MSTGSDRTTIASGYFDDPEKLVRAAEALERTAKGTYVTLNPANPALLARACNRVAVGAKETTSDVGIVCRLRLLIDTDAARPSGISATDAEKAAALKLASEVRLWLGSLGFPEPLVADSGNGGHLVYGIDLPCDDGGLVQRFLLALALRFDTEHVRVDTTVFNPGRITKLYGTLVRKGDDTPDRPHRRSRILEGPQHLDPVPEALLRRVAGLAPPEPPRSTSTGDRTIEVGRLLAQREIEIHRHAPWQGGEKWILQRCPFNADHTDRSAYVLRFPSGAFAAGCHHAGCAGKGWSDLRDLLEPGWRERRGGASGSSVSGGPGGIPHTWPEPQPLPNELPPVKPFDLDLLPRSFVGWVQDIAERIGCPPDFPAVAAMTALSTIVGRKLGIRPKRHDDWLVVPNLWAALIGRPGMFKTPGIQEPLKPLKRLEIEAKAKHAEELKTHAARHMVAGVKEKAQQRTIHAALKANEDDAVAIAQALIDSKPEKPTRKRYIVNDSTVEKLGEILAENPFGVLCYRDELTGFLWSLDKEGQEGARAFYLEAWNGTGRHTYDRIGRGTIDIPAAIVSILGGIQPGPLSGYLRHAVAQTRQDDGLMQRFQLAVWPDSGGKWRNVDRWPDSEAREMAYAVFDRLHMLDPKEIGAAPDEFDPEAIPYVRFSREAQELFDAWRERLENKVRSGEEHPAIESHLAKYRSLIPSLALLIHLADEGNAPVGAGALEKAIEWGDFLDSHMRRIYAVAVNPDAQAARALAAKLLKGELQDGFVARDVYRRCWAHLADRDAAERALVLLVDHDWLADERVQTGGAPKTTYRINPRVWEMAQTPTDKTDKSEDRPPSGSSVRPQSEDCESDYPGPATDKTDGTPAHRATDSPDDGQENSRGPEAGDGEWGSI